MTDPIFQTAHAMARELVQRDCDPNEVHKAFVYLRTHKNGDQFFRLLTSMVQNGRFLVRSGRTLDYYKTILDVCQRYLTNYRADAEKMTQILGWAVRLMRYYMSEQLQSAPRRQQPPRSRRR
jgi:hypothetical protein